MAGRNSTPQGVPLRLLSKPVPAILRGQLHHILGPVAFGEFRRAVCAWSAVQAEAELDGLQRQGGAS